MRPMLICFLAAGFIPGMQAHGFHHVGGNYLDDNRIHSFGTMSHDAGALTVSLQPNLQYANFFIQLPAS